MVCRQPWQNSMIRILSFRTFLVGAAYLLLASCEAQDSSPAAVAPAGMEISERTPVAIDSFGPIEVGMTVTEAEKASGRSLNMPAPVDGSDNCAYGMIAIAQTPLKFMVTNGTIARIDVTGNVPLETTAGAHIGSSEADIMRLYENVEVTPHKYEDGHYLTVTDPAHPNSRYVFETDGRVVTRYRAGRLPEVEFVEGCS
jgi:hypothetical protein